MDKIQISGISCSAHIGVSEEERRSRQEILVDLLLFLDLEAASNTDNMELTVDYSKIIEKVEAAVQESRFCLLESLAHRLCRTLLEDSRLESVEVTVRKFPEVLRDKVTYVAVQMARSNS